MGIANKSGKVIGPVKKHLYQGHKLDRETVAVELGNVIWDISLTAHLINSSMNEVIRVNIVKRQKRYPYGFREEDSVNRAV